MPFHAPARHRRAALALGAIGAAAALGGRIASSAPDSERSWWSPGQGGASALEKLIGFETQVFAAQIADARAGPLVEPGGPAAFGPHALAEGRPSVLANNTTNYVFPIGEAWRQLPRTGDAAHDAQNAAREAIARGHDVFFFRTFWIKDAMHINSTVVSVEP